MIIFRLGRCLLVGVQILLIFKENKITAHHPLATRGKNPNPQKSKTTQRNATKHSNFATGQIYTIIQMVYIQFIQQFVF